MRCGIRSLILVSAAGVGLPVHAQPVSPTSGEDAADAQPAGSTTEIPPGGAVVPAAPTANSNPATSGTAGAPSDEGLFKQREEATHDFVNSLFDLPESPAAFALGLGGTPIARPGSTRDAVAALSSIVGPGGEIVPGVSIEIAPFRLFGAPQTIDDWIAQSQSSQLLQSVRFSLATAQDPGSVDEHSPALVAVGVRIAIIDDRDYRRNPKA